MKRNLTSMAINQQKYREIFEELKKQSTHSLDEDLEFKATIWSFAKFKRITGIKHEVMHGEYRNADKEKYDKFCLEIQKFIVLERYCFQQIFNCDETGLFRKRIPKRTYITKGEKHRLFINNYLRTLYFFKWCKKLWNRCEKALSVIKKKKTFVILIWSTSN